MNSVNAFLFKKHVLGKIKSRVTHFSQIKNAIASEESPSMRGKLFELFSRAMLATDPAFQVKHIYRIEDTPPNILKKLGLKHASDNGIDTIIIDKNERIIAVQDKFRSLSNDNIGWRELSTFFGDSVKADFRIVVTTADHIDRLDKAPTHGRLQKITSAHLNALSACRIKEIVSWIEHSKFTVTRKKTRPHQNKAIRDITKELKKNDRALFISACGTGKTLTSERVMENILSTGGGDAIVFLPSLNLVRQTIRSWSEELVDKRDYRFMAICSDRSVVSGTRNNHDDNADIDFEEIGIPVSTDFTELSHFLNKRRKRGEIRIVYTTYQSSRVIADAIKNTKFKFDFGLFDEAHRTVTAGSSEYVRSKSAFSHGLFDENIPIKKRLFMTATAKKRVQRKVAADRDSFKFISMDDTSKYGNVAHRYTFRQAADDGIICQAKVIVSVVNPKEISEYRINKVSFDNDDMAFEDAARQLAIQKAIKKSDAKRVITYHSRLSDAEYFSKSVKSVLPEWRIGFISSEQGVSVRDKITQIVRDNDYSLVTNVRCLSEGMDFPSVDMVAMMSRIDSKTEVIQIVGRALRKIDAGTKKYGYVMLPLIISSTENIFEDEIAKLGFETIWNVVGALMDDDEELFTTIEDLSVATTSNDRVLRSRLKRQLSKHIDIIGIDSDSLYEAIQTHITSRLHSSFSVGLGHLKSYIDKNGSSSMPTRYTTEDGFPLSKWLANRKSEWTKGKLSAERIKELEKLGVTATTHTQQRKLGLQRLREYIDEHGHADITEEFYKDFPLKSWLASRRKEARKNTGNKKLINEIIKLGIPLRDKPISVFDQGKKHFTDYVKRVGDADVPTLYVTECGFKLGHWVITIRSKWRNKELTRSQVALLNKHGLSKHKYDDNFRTMIELLERMVRETGTINVPRTFTYEGKNVGSWLRDNRKRWRDNKLPAHRIKMLKDLGVDRGLSLAERRKRATKRSPTTKSRVKASATPKKKAS